MRVAPTKVRDGWFPIALAFASGLLAWVAVDDPRWHAALDYRRAAIAAGEAWRLVTAHVMHLSPTHAALDIAGLLLVAWIFDAELGSRSRVAVVIVGMATIDAALWGLHPEVDRYVGLSGVLHAWFAAGAMRWLLASRAESLRLQGRDLAATKRAWGAALLIGLIVKLVLETRHQAFWLDGTSLAVVTAAHRWGAVAGGVYGIGVAWVSRRDAPNVVADRGSRVR